MYIWLNNNIFMSQIRFVLFVLFVLTFCTPKGFAQADTLSVSEIKVLTDTAVSYFNTSQFQKSLLTSRLALNYAIASKDNLLIARCYNIIAGNCHVISQINKAVFYYDKALYHANLTEDNVIKGKINNNLGNIYFFDRKETAKGILHFEKAIEYSNKSNDLLGIFLTKVNITWAYFKIGEFEKGKETLNYVNKHSSELLSPATSTAFYMINAIYAAHLNKSYVAHNYFLKAINEGNKWDKQSDLSYAYLAYSQFLDRVGKPDAAYENLLKYNTIVDQLNNVEIFNKAELEGTNLELDEYKRELIKIENEKLTQIQNLQKSKLINFLSISLSLIFLLLIVTLFRNVNFKKKANAQLLQANEELRLAKEQAEEGSKLKTQFISTISHELRTPLYGVVGITNMLLEEHKELSKSQHLRSLKFSARYLLLLVNDILQINKIEEKKVILEQMTFNISDEVDMIKNSLSFLTQSNNNQILVKVDPAIPEYLIGDKLRLSQILMNLISNALKFTKDGNIFVHINLVKTEGKSHYLEFKIKDTGMGIADLDQDKIFEKFVQVGRKETDYQGTGLGLTIVKHLLSLFDSTISLESVVDKGSTFTFTIAFDHDPEMTTKIINEIDVDLTSKEILRILVVEDNSINQLVTKKIIEKNNYLCTVVEDGFSAIKILKTEQFDIILMDINMPILNGFETTQRIRSLGIETPIVALTAFDKEEVTEDALACGMNDIIIKPFDPLKLFKIINCLVYKNKSEL